MFRVRQAALKTCVVRNRPDGGANPGRRHAQHTECTSVVNLWTPGNGTVERRPAATRRKVFRRCGLRPPASRTSKTRLIGFAAHHVIAALQQHHERRMDRRHDREKLTLCDPRVNRQRVSCNLIVLLHILPPEVRSLAFGPCTAGPHCACQLATPGCVHARVTPHAVQPCGCKDPRRRDSTP